MARVQVLAKEAVAAPAAASTGPAMASSRRVCCAAFVPTTPRSDAREGAGRRSARRGRAVGRERRRREGDAVARSVFGLDQEAIKAAKQFRFVPGTRFGEPVAVLVSSKSNSPSAKSSFDYASPYENFRILSVSSLTFCAERRDVSPRRPPATASATINDAMGKTIGTAALRETTSGVLIKVDLTARPQARTRCTCTRPANATRRCS